MTLRFARFAIAGLAGAFLSITALAQSSTWAVQPATKAVAVETLRLGAQAPQTEIRLDPMDAALIQSARLDNARTVTKRLQIGIARRVDAGILAQSTALQWVPVAGGVAARWVVTSPGARALRVAIAARALVPGVQIRFAGSAMPGVVYGPFGAKDIAASGAGYWSPVLEGESETIELLVPGGASPYGIDASIAQVSHLFASPKESSADILAKAGAGPCEVDLICRSANDPALANIGKSVARMVFTDTGGTFLCTGTLLNPGDGTLTPYFYGANHCISTQAAASTLTTHWFYDRTGCGTGGVSPSYVQLPGGGTLLYADETSDAMLMRLNNPPPAGAVFSGWDAAMIPTGSGLTAIHHPEGDVKKVSLGTMAGYGSPDGTATPTFVVSNWNSIATGVTEAGSSGSGIFTAVGQPAGEYRFRGGLYGGPSSCTASAADLHDYYSRLDQVYPSLSSYLVSGASTSYEGLWLKGDESGWGVNVTQQGTNIFVTWFTYDTDGTGMWLVMSNGSQTSPGNFSGTLYRTVGPGFSATPFTSIRFPDNYTSVGTLSFSFTDANNGTMSYSVNGVSQSKPIQRFIYATTGTSCTLGGALGTSPNYQDLWLRDPTGGSEAGWGINIAHQGDTLFATWFTYLPGSGSNNKGMWLVMSNGNKVSNGVYSGALQTTTGPAFNAVPFDPSSVNRTTVGTGTFTFTDANNGTFDYTVNGVTQSKPIARYIYASPTTVCR